MNQINKSYHFYYCIIPIEKFNSTRFFSDSYFDYIFNYCSPLPNYIEQGICDILPNKSGILFTQSVLEQFDNKILLNDFESCFVFNLPSEICDREQLRYRKNYTFTFDFEKLKEEIPMDLILQYQESPWKPILEIDPDFFYIRGKNEILVGSKDYKQVVDWSDEIMNFKNSPSLIS